MIINNIVRSVAIASALMAGLTYADTPINPAQKTEIEQVVRNYLIQNPDVVVQSLQAYQQKQIDEAKKTMQKTQDIAPKFAEALFKTPNDPMAGNVKGGVTMVEFFDYQCPHCVEMMPVIEGVIKANPNLRVVFKEFPIRGPLSEFAVKAALAAQKQGKYYEFHKALMQSMQSNARLSEESILNIAKSVGLNMNMLKTDMKSDAIAKQIKTNYKLAQDLGLLGTPAFFVAKYDVNSHVTPTVVEFVPGQVDQSQMQSVIDKFK